MASDAPRSPPILACAAVLALALSALLPWISPPLEVRIRGYACPLLREPSLALGLANRPRADSVGAVVGAIAALGALALLAGRPPRALAHVGGVAALACTAFAADIAFRNPDLLERIAEQSEQVEGIAAFSLAELGGNAGRGDTGEGATTQDLAAGTDAGTGVLGAGFWLASAGALGLILAACRASPGATGAFAGTAGVSAGAMGVSAGASAGTAGARRASAAWAAACLAVAGALGAEPIRGELDRSQAEVELARGDLGRAIEAFQAALRHVPALARNASFTHGLGGALERSGFRGRPEAIAYRGDEKLAIGDMIGAIQEYEIAEAAGADRTLMARLRVRALIRLGQNRYSAKVPHAAIEAWRRALAIDPDRVDARLFLAKACFDVDGRDQSRAIAAAGAVIEGTREKLIRSDVYNLLGDAYYKQQDFAAARDMYRLSRKQYLLVKKFINFGAMKGLQGL